MYVLPASSTSLPTKVSRARERISTTLPSGRRLPVLGSALSPTSCTFTMSPWSAWDIASAGIKASSSLLGMSKKPIPFLVALMTPSYISPFFGIFLTLAISRPFCYSGGHMLMIRFQRIGRTNDPAFRIVVLEKERAAKSGRITDLIGTYNPRSKALTLDEAKVRAWIANGAQPTPSLHNLLITKGIITGKKINVLPRKHPIKAEGEPTPPNTAPAPLPAEAPAKEVLPVEEAPAEELKTEETPATA